MKLLRCAEDRWLFRAATRQVAQLVSDFQDHQRAVADAPRLAEVLRSFDHIAALVTDLRDPLQALEETLSLYSHELFGSVLGRKFDPWEVEPSPELTGHAPSPRLDLRQLQMQLDMLAKFCGAANAAIAEKRLAEGEAAGDLGGATNLEKQYGGSAKWRLVHAAGRLFAEHRPDRISSNANGDLFGFCAAMFEVCTGLDPEGEGVGLKRYVEFLAPRLAKLWEQYALRHDLWLMRGSRLSLRLDQGLDLDPRIKASSAEIARLEIELQRGPRERTRRRPALTEVG
jgi:hypothetical protein